MVEFVRQQKFPYLLLIKCSCVLEAVLQLKIDIGLFNDAVSVEMRRAVNISTG